jgi:hypothetical protein
MDNLKEAGVEATILKWMLKKYDRKAWTGFIWLWRGTRGGLL